MQIWTLIVAGLAVLATVISAALLRRTGKGTVVAAETAAHASKQSAQAAERSAAVAVASLTEAMAVSASTPAEEFFLGHLVERRKDAQQRLDAMWSISFQLAAVMLTARRKDWEDGLSIHSPAGLVLPMVDVEPAMMSALPMALTSLLASIAASTARFEAVKYSATSEDCWHILRSIEVDARKGRQVLDQTLSGAQSLEARLTSEIREMQNLIGKWRRERHQHTLERFGVETPSAADDSADAPE